MPQLNPLFESPRQRKSCKVKDLLKLLAFIPSFRRELYKRIQAANEGDESTEDLTYLENGRDEFGDEERDTDNVPTTDTHQTAEVVEIEVTRHRSGTAERPHRTKKKSRARFEE